MMRPRPGPTKVLCPFTALVLLAEFLLIVLLFVQIVIVLPRLSLFASTFQLNEIPLIGGNPLTFSE